MNQKNNKKGLFNCIVYGFAVIGVLATLAGIVILGGVAYFWYADPYNIKEFISPMQWQEQIETSSTSSTKSVEESNNLPFTQQQLQMMSTFGIDVENLQNMDPQKLQNCSKEKLGEDRYNKIITGEITPNFSDVNKFKECVN